VIFAMSSVPGSNLPPGPYGTLAHFVEYALLTMLMFSALRVDRPRMQAAVLAILLASAYGITDEVHQAFVPLRTPDPLDWITDTAGAATGALIALTVEQLASRRS
jgi:VanZ family protein